MRSIPIKPKKGHSCKWPKNKKEMVTKPPSFLEGGRDIKRELGLAELKSEALPGLFPGSV